MASARPWGRLLAACLLAAAPLLSLAQALPAAATTGLTVGSNTSVYQEPDFPAFHIFGEVSNSSGSDPAQNVRVTCTLYGPGPGNAILANETADAALAIILGGENSPFDATFPRQAFDHYGCVLTHGVATTTVADHMFTTAVTGEYTDGEGLPHVTGTVTNNNDIARSNLTAVLTFYDSNGTVIDEGTAGVDGPIAAGATVNFDLTRNSVAWDGVHWRAVTEALSPAVSLSQPVTFADQISGTTSSPSTVTVSNVGTGDLHIPANGVTLQGTDATYFAIATDGCSGQTVAPGSSCPVGVTFTPNAVRSFSAALQVSDDADANPQSVALSGNGLSRAAISSDASSPLDFGTVLVNSSTNQTVTLSSSGLSDAPATITAIGLDSTTDFTVDSSGCAPSGFPTAPMAAATGCPIKITFTPSTTGLRKAKLTITAVDGSGAATRNSPLVLSLQGTGTEAAASVQPTNVDFGSVVANTTSSPKPVTVSSTGSGPLVISKISTTGPFTETDNCQSPVTTPNSCTVQVRFAPTASGPANGTLVIDSNAAGGIAPVNLSGTGTGGTTFYFAEGFTGNGFNETLDLLLPKQNGSATIDYYTEQGHQPTVVVPLTAGVVAIENVNSDVGANHQVSARVILSAPGVVERVMHFNNGTWYGSSDIVGTSRPMKEWDFAEGSTLSAFNEFLSLQNPNSVPANITLNYATDVPGFHPTRTLQLPANTRTTIEVFQGDRSGQVLGCDPLASCGVGSGVVGVSVQVLSDQPIVAERPMYVMNFSFGSGNIRGGHVAFGANAPAHTWYFAEGNSLNGFNEYLTIQNPGATAANVTLHYIYDLGTRSVNLVVNGNSRQTALVFDPSHFGLGRAYVGISVVVTADQPIVVERPMYMVFDFGSGPVASAHDVMGATSPGTLFGFAYASTLAGDNDYLTIQNSNGATANLTITYYKQNGTTVTKNLAVPGNTRHTVLIFGSSEGVGSGIAPVGIVVSSDQLIQVEKPTYSANTQTYGATDTLGYSPASF